MGRSTGKVNEKKHERYRAKPLAETRRKLIQTTIMIKSGKINDEFARYGISLGIFSDDRMKRGQAYCIASQFSGRHQHFYRQSLVPQSNGQSAQDGKWRTSATV